MNFSELFKQTNQLCNFSPNGEYLANCVQYRLIIRDVKTLQIIQLYTCLDGIQYIEWSSDSKFVLCGMYKRGIVQVWSLDQSEWTCKIDEGSAGLVAVRWSPDGRHILTTADFHLRITVWSLVNKSVSYIKYPKDTKQGIDFSRDGKYMALAERRDGQDFISIFAANTWHLVKHFESNTRDLQGVEWSPDGRVLCVWDSILEVRVLNHITWKTVAEHNHVPILDNTSVVTYREVEKRPKVIKPDRTWPPMSSMFSIQSKYEIQDNPVQIPVVKPDPDKPNPKIGVSMVSFSPDNKYMASKNENMPNALWIWDVQKLTQVVLMLQVNSIRCLQWDPHQPRLAMSTSNNKMYMWSPAGCVSVEVPTEASFQVNSLQWSPDGAAILLMGKDRMCVCFLADPDT